jgi:streptogramin lyase
VRATEARKSYQFPPGAGQCDVAVLASGGAKGVVYFAVTGIHAVFAAQVDAGTGALKYLGRLNVPATPLAITVDAEGTVWISAAAPKLATYRPVATGEGWPLAPAASSAVDAIVANDAQFACPVENLLRREQGFPRGKEHHVQ